MHCLKCGCEESKVIDSRMVEESNSIRRRRECQTIEKAADEIEAELNNMMIKEIDSTKIGDMVIEKLKQLDEIAYVRFASVYRQFKDINEFKKEINKLLR